MGEIFSPWMSGGNNFLSLCQIIMFNVDVSDFHDDVEHTICFNRKIPKIVKTAQTIMKTAAVTCTL
jgi:hypothetical protein